MGPFGWHENQLKNTVHGWKHCSVLVTIMVVKLHQHRIFPFWWLRAVRLTWKSAENTVHCWKYCSFFHKFLHIPLNSSKRTGHMFIWKAEGPFMPGRAIDIICTWARSDSAAHDKIRRVAFLVHCSSCYLCNCFSSTNLFFQSRE